MTPATPVPFYCAAVIIEALYLWRFFSNNCKKSSSYIVIVVWAFLIIWEVCSTDLKLTHPVLIPLPENVFNVFPKLHTELMRNIISSLTLLGAGYFSALILGNILGLFAAQRNGIPYCACIGTYSCHCVCTVFDYAYAKFPFGCYCGNFSWYFLAHLT